MQQILLAVVCACTLTMSLAAQGGKIIGVWKIVESNDTRGVRNSQYMFTAKHFSRMAELGAEARKQFTTPRGTEATSEEKTAAFDTFMANAGTYEVSGDTLILTVKMAKVPNVVSSTPSKMRMKVDGDTLLLSNPENEKQFIKLTRIE